MFDDCYKNEDKCEHIDNIVLISAIPDYGYPCMFARDSKYDGLTLSNIGDEISKKNISFSIVYPGGNESPTHLELFKKLNRHMNVESSNLGTPEISIMLVGLLSEVYSEGRSAKKQKLDTGHRSATPSSQHKLGISDYDSSKMSPAYSIQTPGSAKNSNFDSVENIDAPKSARMECEMEHDKNASDNGDKSQFSRLSTHSFSEKVKPENPPKIQISTQEAIPTDMKNLEVNLKQNLEQKYSKPSPISPTNKENLPQEASPQNPIFSGQNKANNSSFSSGQPVWNGYILFDISDDNNNTPKRMGCAVSASRFPGSSSDTDELQTDQWPNNITVSMIVNCSYEVVSLAYSELKPPLVILHPINLQDYSSKRIYESIGELLIRKEQVAIAEHFQNSSHGLFIFRNKRFPFLLAMVFDKLKLDSVFVYLDVFQKSPKGHINNQLEQHKRIPKTKQTQQKIQQQHPIQQELQIQQPHMVQHSHRIQPMQQVQPMQQAHLIQQAHSIQQPMPMRQPHPVQQAHPAQMQQAHPAQMQQAHPAQMQQAHPTQMQQAHPTQMQQAHLTQMQQAHPAQMQQAHPAQMQQAHPAQMQQAHPAQMQHPIQYISSYPTQQHANMQQRAQQQQAKMEQVNLKRTKQPIQQHTFQRQEVQQQNAQHRAMHQQSVNQQALQQQMSLQRQYAIQQQVAHQQALQQQAAHQNAHSYIQQMMMANRPKK